MKTENLNPPDEPRTRVCPDCLGQYLGCPTCEGDGEVVMFLEDDDYFDEVRADDERSNNNE